MFDRVLIKPLKHVENYRYLDLEIIGMIWKLLERARFYVKQKQPSMSVHIKRRSVNMQQVQRRTPLPIVISIKLQSNFKSHFGICIFL